MILSCLAHGLPYPATHPTIDLVIVFRTFVVLQCTPVERVNVASVHYCMYSIASMSCVCGVQTLLSLSKLSALAVLELSDDLISNVDGMWHVLYYHLAYI